MALLKDISPLIASGVACILAAFGLSLFFEGYADIIYAPATILLLAAALLTILPGLKAGTLTMPRSASALLLAVLWLYITLSLTWSTVPFTSLITWLVFLALPLTFFALSLSNRRQDWLPAAVIALLTALTLLGGWAVIQFLFLQNVYGPRAHHPLINANNLATLLNLGLLPVIAFLIYRPQADSLYKLAFAAALLLFGGLIATGSRSGFVFFVLASLFMVIVLRHRIRTSAKKNLLLLAAGCALFGLFHVTGGGQMAGRLADLAAPLPEQGIASRLSLWGQAWEMFKTDPLTGTGLGTFYLYYPAYRVPFADNSAGNWVHMDSLQLSLETGLLSLLLIYALLIAILIRTIKALRATKPEAWERAAITGLFCGLLAVALHAHTSFPLYVMPILIICGIWLAAWHHLTASALETGSSISLPLTVIERRSVIACALVTAGLVAFITLSSAAGQHYLIKAHASISKGQVTGFLDNIEKAQMLAPGSFIDPQVQLTGLYIDLLEPGDILFTIEEQREMFETGLKLLEEAEAMNPAWAEIDYKRGRLYEVTRPDIAENGQIQAINSWQKGLDKDPTHVKTRLSLARAYFSRGEAFAAYQILEQGLGFPLYPEQQREITAFMQEIAPLARVQQQYRERIIQQTESTP